MSNKEQAGEQAFRNLLANRNKLYQLYLAEDFQQLLLPYLEAELSNRMEELLFNKYDGKERSLIQGKAQALYAIIHLPEELKELKSIEEQEEEMLKKLREEHEEDLYEEK